MTASATAATPALPCRCSHPKAQHGTPGTPPRCNAAGCSCQQYRPVIAPPALELVAGAEAGPTIEQVIAAALRSTSPRVVALADKIEDQLADLRRRLREERAAAEAREQIAELEERLAKARATLRGLKPAATRAQTAPSSATGTFACPDCPDVFNTPQGRGMHRVRAHGYRRGGGA